MFVLRRLYSKQAPKFKNKLSRKSRADPGIYTRKNLFMKEDQGDMENMDFEDMESDFMDVHKSYGKHLEEEKIQKEREKYLLVKQKYFKEDFPNFLTWYDKEQIRYLYNEDPDEWTVEKLSEGFPALPDVIRKIIKSAKWTKKNQKSILKHDNTVLQNWNDFCGGKLNNLPQDLKEHLQKFSKRSLLLKSENSTNKELTSNNSTVPCQGEFFEIINSYKKLEENKRKQPVEPSSEANSIVETNNKMLNLKNFSTRLTTFQQLQEKVESKLSKGKDISFQEKLIVQAKFPIKETENRVDMEQENLAIEIKPEDTKNKVGFVTKTSKDLSHLIYPNKIVIPKRIYKRGYTYKLNDCYYDSDGWFLYRVPGMD